MDLEKMRKEYSDHGISIDSIGKDPLALFEQWLETAVENKVQEPTAFVLSTVDHEQKPTSRTLLLKKIENQCLYFFTNYTSTKAKHLEENPNISACFPWLQIEKQVLIRGRVRKCTKKENAEYFASRPRGSQLGAWASKQSTQIKSRAALDSQFSKAQERFINKEIPLPDFWGGYQIIPDAYEFWSGRRNRMHDRFLFQKTADRWTLSRLSP